MALEFEARRRYHGRGLVRRQRVVAVDLALPAPCRLPEIPALNATQLPVMTHQPTGPVEPGAEGSTGSRPVTGARTAGGTGALVLGVAALLSLLAHLRIDGTLIDDAFITYRYAANLAEGLGLVYNPGERVLGTTTPGWALLLAVVARVAGPAAIPAVAPALAGLFLAATGVLCRRLLRGLGARSLVAGLGAALIVLAPHQLYAGLSGMETALFNLLLALSLVGVVEGRWWLAASAGLLPVVRPEGVLVAAVVGLDMAAAQFRLLRARDRGRPGALPFLLLIGPGAVLLGSLLLYYGTVVPHSVLAKRAGLYPIGIGESYAAVVQRLIRVLPAAEAVPWPSLLVPVLLLAGAGVAVARRPSLWPLPVVLIGYLLFYGTSATLIFPHYIALVEPFAFAAWAFALAWVLDRAVGLVRARLPHGRGGSASEAGPVRGADPAVPGWSAPWIAPAAIGLLIVQQLVWYPVASVVAGSPDPRDSVVSPTDLRQAYYRAAADVVGPAIPAGTTALMPEIGELGFHLRHVRVLDAAALVSPEAIAHLPVPPDERVAADVGAIPTALVTAEVPDLVITLDLFARESLYQDAWFRQNYRTVWGWHAPSLVWGPLRIHARQGFRPADRLRALPGGVAEAGAVAAPEPSTSS